MKFLRVPPEKLERYQHYHDVRDRVWIKLYTSLLDADNDVDYALLPDATKALLHHIWLLAARTNNRIPYTRDWISKQKLNLRSAVNLTELLARGFIEVYEDSLEGFLAPPLEPILVSHASLSLSSKSLPGDSPKAEFESLWSEYPKKRGRDDAFRHFTAQVRTPADLVAIRSSIRNYKRELEILGTEERYTLHGSTFFNRKWRDYVDGVWKEPRPKGKAVATKTFTPMRKAE